MTIKKGVAARAAVLVLVVAAALLGMIPYAWAMACPGDGGDAFSLRIQSVTIDGVEQQELSDYYLHERVATLIIADKTRSQAAEGENLIAADHLILHFTARVGGLGSYDEIFVLILTLASLPALLGMSECGPCPDNRHFELVSGTYTQLELLEMTTPGPDAPPFPHLDATDVTVRVDVENQTAVVEYQREGQTVVETWTW